MAWGWGEKGLPPSWLFRDPGFQLSTCSSESLRGRERETFCAGFQAFYPEAILLTVHLLKQDTKHGELQRGWGMQSYHESVKRRIKTSH